MEFIEPALSFLREGFRQVNAVQGLVIALGAALLTPGWRRLPAFVAGAVIVHVLADVALPVIAGGARPALPPLLELAFWRHVALLAAGYLVVIAAFVLVRNVVLRR
ncbi:MAG: hypothetical protein KIS81_02920 [Maricaulaceae bacterium]|nr:hypothetical protein [Maricaulaceae bacterium]